MKKTLLEQGGSGWLNQSPGKLLKKKTLLKQGGLGVLFGKKVIQTIVLKDYQGARLENDESSEKGDSQYSGKPCK